MIIESSKNVYEELGKKYVQVSQLNFNLIFDYVNFTEFYSSMITLLWKKSNERERFIVNSTISFFCIFREYIFANAGGVINEGEALIYFETLVERLKYLLYRNKEIVYLYEPTLEVRQFCEYYDFKFIEISDPSEFESLVRAYARKKQVL